MPPSSDAPDPEHQEAAPDPRRPLEPIPPLEELLPFVVPHDGAQPEVSLVEQEMVAQKFDALVDDLQLNAADEVEHFPTAVPEDRLRLKIPAEGIARWHGEVVVRTDALTHETPLPPSEVTVKAVNLSYYTSDQGGPTRHFVCYRLCADGVVRRFTGGDTAMKHQERRELDSAAGVLKPKTVAQERDRITSAFTEMVKSRRAERQLGFQNQPVGLSEMDGLTDFLTQPGIIVVDDEFRRRR